jgi:septal ring factor EnvC (AmiA/AmiB activator)
MRNIIFFMILFSASGLLQCCLFQKNSEIELKLNEEINKLKNENSDLKKSINTNNNLITRLQNENNNNKKIISQLKDENAKLKADNDKYYRAEEQFDFSINDVNSTKRFSDQNLYITLTSFYKEHSWVNLKIGTSSNNALDYTDKHAGDRITFENYIIIILKITNNNVEILVQKGKKINKL